MVHCVKPFVLLLLCIKAFVARRAVQSKEPPPPSLDALREDREVADFDIFIIGGGSAGIRLAKALGREPSVRVGIAENRDFGGTCVNRGCNPKKTLVTATGFINAMDAARASGVWNINASLNWDALQKLRAQKVNAVSNYYSASIRKPSNVKVFEEQASVAGRHLVKVGSSFKRVIAVVLCTGGEPRRLEFEGSDLPEVITSDEALELPSKPDSMLVVGGGYIAAEMASFFQQAGTTVSMSIRSRLLKSFDSDVTAITEDSLKLRGIQLLYETTVQSVRRTGNSGVVEVILRGQRAPVYVERVLLAVGRVPLTIGLGLEDVGVKLDQGGKVLVNRFGQSSTNWIFALGDIAAGGLELQTWAVKQADALLEVLLGRSSATVQPVVPPEHVATALFTTPRAGSVGLTEEQARERVADDILVLVEKTGPCTALHNWGMLKIVIHRSTDRVLGIHIAGKGADELIQAFAVVMALDPTWSACKQALAVHPTATEYLIFMNEAKSVKKGRWRLADCVKP